MCAVCLDTEIRKLKPAELYTLGNILHFSDSWKKLMAIVVKHGNVPRFNNDHIGMIEQTASKDKRNAAQMFLDEWSTMGRKRPTLRVLLELLIKAELFRAADYVACDILKQEKPKRPDCGPAALIDVSDTIVDQLLRKQQQIHQRNVFADSVILGSASELISEINGPCDNVVNDKNEIADKHLLDMTNSLCDYEKPVDILSETAASPGGCSVAEKTVDTADKAESRGTEVISALTDGPKSEETPKGADRSEKPDIADQHYKYEEVSSQELPIFINSEQSAAVFDGEMCSSDSSLLNL